MTTAVFVAVDVSSCHILPFCVSMCVCVRADLIKAEECQSEEAWQEGEGSSSELEDEEEQRQNSEVEEEEEEEEEEGEHRPDDSHNHMVGSYLSMCAGNRRVFW